MKRKRLTQKQLAIQNQYLTNPRLVNLYKEVIDELNTIIKEEIEGFSSDGKILLFEPLNFLFLLGQEFAYVKKTKPSSFKSHFHNIQFNNSPLNNFQKRYLLQKLVELVKKESEKKELKINTVADLLSRPQELE